LLRQFSERVGPVRPASWSRKVRTIIVAAWGIAAVAGLAAGADLSNRLSNPAEVPGTQSQAVALKLERYFHENIAGSFVVVFKATPELWRSRGFVEQTRAAVYRAARAAHGEARPLQSASPEVVYAPIITNLPDAVAQKRTDAVRASIGRLPGTTVHVTGYPAATQDLIGVIARDLQRAESISIPITLLVLLLLFGSLPAVAIPLLFAFSTISVTIGTVWVETHFAAIPAYASNLVTLVGIAIAVDYSMLYVARYREEAINAASSSEALAVTAKTAGRTLVASGATVAVGLAPLAFMPLPFFSGLGLAALVIPIVSVLAALSLLPTLLAILAPNLERFQVKLPARIRRRTDAAYSGHFWERFANGVMRRAGPYAIAASLVMLLIAAPVTKMIVTGGTGGKYGNILDEAAFTPYEILIDTSHNSGAVSSNAVASERRLLRRLAQDAEVSSIQAPAELEPGQADIATNSAEQAKAIALGLLDPHKRLIRIRVFGQHGSGSSQAMNLVNRIRSQYLPHDVREYVGGLPAAETDFVNKMENNVPLLLIITVGAIYLLLVRAFRSIFLPLKAIVMNCLSLAATYGVLVVVFQMGWGQVIGLSQTGQIAAWVPVLLFGALFGISTDYEVFMITRMREEWDSTHDNERSVALGLQRCGRIVTASALVMIVIFTGFTVSHVVALQEFGVGLVAAVFFDATIVRLLLVPSLMKLMGRWNWYMIGEARSPLELESVGER
jgi:putative drug exporter of the RND superfamily